MKKSTAKVVAHSKAPNGDELITIVGTFPRIILAEINTHRMLSKNTSSSRAIPFFKMVKSITDNPFIPYAFQKHHKGMQGTEYLDPNKRITWEEIQPTIFENLSKHFSQEDENDLEVLDVFMTYVQPLFDQGDNSGKTPAEWWLKTRDIVVGCAIILYSMGVTKQIANRLLEPFMWVTDIITGTRDAWEGFFRLRCPSYTMQTESGTESYRSREELLLWNDAINNISISEEEFLEFNTGQAEIHMMDFAETCWNVIRKSVPRELETGEWHIPFRDKIKPESFTHLSVEDVNYSTSENFIKIIEREKIKISTAMCARVSYTIVGDEKEVSMEDLIRVYDEKLIGQDPPHSSPFEHCARVMSDDEYYEFRRGELFEDTDTGFLLATHGSEGWCNNFKGFIQLRYLIERENFKL